MDPPAYTVVGKVAEQNRLTRVKAMIALPSSPAYNPAIEEPMKHPLPPLVLFCASTALPLFPATVLVNPNPIVIANSVTDIVSGADMTGLIVTASYNTPPPTPTTVTAVWAPTGPTSGAASVVVAPFGPILTVSVTGSASGTLAWQYTSMFLSPLISLTLDGSAAGIYFDRAHSGPGTPGSGTGADISFGPLLPDNSIENFVVVTYSGAVSLDGNAPENDLYAEMTISFAGVPPLGGLEPQDFAFTQPADRNVAPEPTSALFVLAGLAALSVRWMVLRSAYRGGDS